MPEDCVVVTLAELMVVVIVPLATTVPLVLERFELDTVDEPVVVDDPDVVGNPNDDDVLLNTPEVVEFCVPVLANPVLVVLVELVVVVVVLLIGPVPIVLKEVELDVELDPPGVVLSVVVDTAPSKVPVKMTVYEPVAVLFVSSLKLPEVSVTVGPPVVGTVAPLVIVPLVEDVVIEVVEFVKPVFVTLLELEVTVELVVDPDDVVVLLSEFVTVVLESVLVVFNKLGVVVVEAEDVGEVVLPVVVVFGRATFLTSATYPGFMFSVYAPGLYKVQVSGSVKSNATQLASLVHIARQSLRLAAVTLAWPLACLLILLTTGRSEVSQYTV